MHTSGGICIVYNMMHNPENGPDLLRNMITYMRKHPFRDTVMRSSLMDNNWHF